jgi:hypothetical protein
LWFAVNKPKQRKADKKKFLTTRRTGSTAVNAAWADLDAISGASRSKSHDLAVKSGDFVFKSLDSAAKSIDVAAKAIDSAIKSADLAATSIDSHAKSSAVLCESVDLFSKSVDWEIFAVSSDRLIFGSCPETDATVANQIEWHRSSLLPGGVNMTAAIHSDRWHVRCICPIAKAHHE